MANDGGLTCECTHATACVFHGVVPELPPSKSEAALRKLLADVQACDRWVNEPGMSNFDKAPGFVQDFAKNSPQSFRHMLDYLERLAREGLGES